MHLAVIGAGPGGYVAALKAAALGAEVTVIENAEVGGTCLNRGCIPTKALLYSSSMYARATKLDKYGIDLDGSVSPNLASMMARKDKVVGTQVKGIRGLLKSAGITLLQGRGWLAGEGKVDVAHPDGTVSQVKADKIILATGSRPLEIPALPFDGKQVLSSDDALKLTSIPQSMIIVGAGVIGSEFACIFSDLGTNVTMVEMLDRPVATEDTEVSALLTREFKKKKIKLMTSTGVESVETTNSGVTATLSDTKTIEAEIMLVSTGRALNTRDLGLDACKVQRGQKGEITVNEKMETTAPGVYAIGDATGGVLLAHTASAEGMVAARNACGQEASMDYSCIPAAIFTTPEIASVGLRDFEVKEKKIEANIGMFQYRALGKAHAMGEITGFFKIIADKKTDRVLGVHIIGEHAADIIHEAALAIKKGLTASDIAGTIHAHPALSEGLMEAAEDVHGQAVHLSRKK